MSVEWTAPIVTSGNRKGRWKYPHCINKETQRLLMIQSHKTENQQFLFTLLYSCCPCANCKLFCFHGVTRMRSSSSGDTGPEGKGNCSGSQGVLGSGLPGLTFPCSLSPELLNMQGSGANCAPRAKQRMLYSAKGCCQISQGARGTFREWLFCGRS